jgi:hypothetical protein
MQNGHASKNHTIRGVLFSPPHTLRVLGFIW